MAVAPKDRWFEDFPVGEIAEFGDHVVTAEEIVAFGRRYDPQPMHADPAAAAATAWGGLIASGWMTCAIAMRLVVDHWVPLAASVASPGIDEIRWKRPVRPGDRLRLRVEVIAARASAGRPDRGLVQTRQTLLNAAGEEVMTLKGWGVYLRRPIK